MRVHDLRRFDPDALAKLDADMWVAYYNHHFVKLTWLLFRLSPTKLLRQPIVTLRTTYHSAMAAIVFRKTKGHEDNERVLRHLVAFYRLLSEHNVRAFDFQKAAELELAWWLVDRYPEKYSTTRGEALAEGMAAIYQVPVAKLQTYGLKRAAAMELLGAYHYDTKAAVDWPKLRRLLQESYRALHDAVQ